MEKGFKIALGMVGIAAIVLYFKNKQEIAEGQRVDPAALLREIVSFDKQAGVTPPLDPFVMLAVAETESDFIIRSVGSSGEVGIFQMKPAAFVDSQKVGSELWDYQAIKTSWKRSAKSAWNYYRWIEDRIGKGKTNWILQAYNVGVAGFNKGKRNYTYLAKILARSLKWRAFFLVNDLKEGINNAKN